jgi:hypothetical protein
MSKVRELTDKWQLLDDARLAANREATRATTEAQQAKLELIAAMKDVDLTATGGTHITATIQYKIVPTVSDWEMFYQYIKDNDAFDLLQKRVGVKAVAVRWEDELSIPGVEPYEIEELKRKKL